MILNKIKKDNLSNSINVKNEKYKYSNKQRYDYFDKKQIIIFN